MNTKRHLLLEVTALDSPGYIRGTLGGPFGIALGYYALVPIAAENIVPHPVLPIREAELPAPMNTPSEASAELARVVELLEKEPPAREVERIARNQDDAWVCWSFLRKHGASLLSSHGGGGEAVAVPEVVAYPSTVLEPRAKRIDEWLEGWLETCDAHQAIVYRAAIDFIRAKDTPPPQPRAEGWAEAARDWIALVPHGDNCFVSDAYEGDPGNRCNCGKESLLAAAPGEGSTAPRVEGWHCPRCAMDLQPAEVTYHEECAHCGTDVSSTPPPASQSATPSDGYIERLRDMREALNIHAETMTGAARIGAEADCAALDEAIRKGGAQ